jgi:hypothetical protein
MQSDNFYYNQNDKPEQSNLYRDYLRYLDTESDLESMIADNVLDIYVDEKGTFHYITTQEILNSLPHGYKAKMATFADMLSLRGLNINRYNRYKQMLRRMNP